MKRALVSISVLAVMLVACTRGVGSKCKGNESLCSGKKNALACHDGKLEQVPCGGPLGCTKVQDQAVCDDSVADENMPCMASGDEEYACSLDKKRALACRNKHFERYLECRGKGGCSLLGQQISCDTSIASKGEPCKNENAVSCSEDLKQLIICREGRFEAFRYCRGAYGCHFKGDVPTCDETLSLEGDPCALQGYFVCSVDGKDELVCQGNAFMRSRSCKKGCTVTNRAGRPIDCD